MAKIITGINSDIEVQPGSTVSIAGTGFGPVVANNLVILGNVILKVKSWSDTSISVQIPLGVDYGPRLQIWDKATGEKSNSLPVEIASFRVDSMYTTAQNLKNAQGSINLSAIEPDVLDDLIKDISAEIDNYCKRPYGLMRQMVVENVIGKGTDLIPLRNYRGREARDWVFNVREILVKSVDEFPGVFAYEIDPQALEVDPESATLHLKDSLLFKAISRNYADIPGYTYIPENSLVRVVYETGYSVVPRDLKRACEMLALRRTNQASLNFAADAPQRVKVSKIEIEMARPVYGHRTLDDDIKDLLKGYLLQSAIG